MAAHQPGTPRQGDAPQAETVFETVWRGFDPDQVRSHLHLLQGRLGELGSRLDRTQRMLEEAQRDRDQARATASIGSYEGVSSHVVDLIRLFDQDVENLRREAEADANRILAEAKAEAAQLRSQVQAEDREVRARAEDMLRSAREESDRIRGELEPVRETTLTRMREMRERMASAVRELDHILSAVPAEERIVVVGEAAPSAPETGPAPSVPGRSA
jgi:hypothetical protein